ncbi:MAG: YidC/Oxa1 family membrane protein insertase [Dehalococcoidales bacterium]
MDAGIIWDTIILSPMINVMIVLSDVLFGNLGLTIIVLTIIVRAAMFPLTRRQLRATRQMQELQPKLAEIRKKYARDRQKRAKEEMAVMKQSGVSPAGCVLPMLIQMPVWIALYQSIIRVLGATPEQFLNLSRHLYTTWPQVFSLVPLESRFLWLNLANVDTTYILPVLVGGTMWLQQKMVTPTSSDPAQQTQGRMMLWMMPLMFGFFTMSFPSGLALYWVASNIITIALQYFTGGWGGLAGVFRFGQTDSRQAPPKRLPPAEKKEITTGTRTTEADDEGEDEAEASSRASSSDEAPGPEREVDDGTSGNKRPDSRRSRADSSRPAKRQPQRGKSRRPKRR